jgi:flagellar export protein FliJ
MKRFEFGLTSVLRMRRAAEEAAKVELAAANNALGEAIARRDRERERCRTLTPSAGPEGYDAFCADALAGSLAARTHADAQASVARAASVAALAQLTWAARAKDVAVLDRLYERRHSEHLAAERVAEAAVLDDLVTARYAFNLSRHEPETAR